MNNISIGELSTWCPECGQTVGIIKPGWVKCPRCLWEEFKFGESRPAAVEIKRRLVWAEVQDEGDLVRIPLGKKRGGGRKSRRRRSQGKRWWKPWYMRCGV